MITAAATADDFQRWEIQARAMDSVSLHFTIADCKRAAEAMRGWNPSREGYYIDQMLTFADERRKRQNIS